MHQLYLGDCIEILRKRKSDSLDAVVTDPPAGIGFMGKGWDSSRGGHDQWISWMQEAMAEVLRVLKPGAHGLVWALPRTSHWTAIACERAGFEIRDCITHVFGSGFPKASALNRAKSGEFCQCDASKHNSGQNPLGRSDTLQSQSAFPPPCTMCGKPDPKGWYNGGLKPASEHWWLIRKPLGEKTVAANVLKHGTGGVNIDASRVGGGDERRMCGTTDKSGETSYVLGAREETRTTQGRFPANLIVDESAVAELDRQSGVSKSTGGTKSIKQHAGNAEMNASKSGANPYFNFGDTGGASRFFYIPKASKRDRNEGLEGMPEKPMNTYNFSEDGSMQANLTAKNGVQKRLGRQNHHPTVKNTKLMEYLITMITPPGGTVLDPFMGSGSTGVAANRLGFRFVGIEKEAEYFEIATKRMGQ